MNAKHHSNINILIQEKNAEYPTSNLNISTPTKTMKVNKIDLN